MDTAAVVQTVHFSAIFNSGYVRLNYTVWLDLFKSEQSACAANGHNIVDSIDCVFCSTQCCCTPSGLGILPMFRIK